jgi:DNA-binding FadR family transcriptional regulator
LSDETERSIEARSLKAQCAALLERLIISGVLAVGSTLPPERDFAKSLGVSRPVLHEAIVELASKGFLHIEPRRGVRVKDFYREGTLAIFEAIILHGKGNFPASVLADVVAFRSLIELEAVRLAAGIGGGDCLGRLRAHLAEEEGLPPLPAGLEARVALDVGFHVLVAEASGNRILPLVINSLSPIYASLVERFYKTGPDLARVGKWHRDIVEALARRDVEAALALSREMLDHGSRAIGA